MPDHRKAFLALSVEVTGYDATDLEGTGLVDEYQALVESVTGSAIAAQLYDTMEEVHRAAPGAARERAMRIDVLASPILWPVLANLIQLWYTGQWNAMPPACYQVSGAKKSADDTTHVPSVRAYAEQLAYRAAGAHPPGAKPTGHASWSIPPVFGDRLPDPAPHATEAR